MGKKIAIGIFSGILLVGVILSIVGLALGGSYGYFTVRDRQFVFKNNQNTYELWDVPGWYRGDTGNMYVGFHLWDDDMPIAASGASEASVPQNMSELTTLKLDIAAGFVTITPGDEASLTVQGPLQYETSFEDGVWKIEAHHEDITARNNRFFLNGEDVTTTFDIVLPQELLRIQADVALGSLTVGALTVQEADLNADLAETKITGLTADRLALSTGLGAIRAVEMTARHCEIETDLASVHYEGKITEYLEGSCSLGSLSLQLNKPASYGYSASSDLGSIRIDGQTRKGEQGSEDENEVFYDLDCDLGSIEIQFR